MDTNEEKLLLRDEVFQIGGCAIEVLNPLGHGMVEKPNEKALVVEFCTNKNSVPAVPKAFGIKLSPYYELARWSDS